MCKMYIGKVLLVLLFTFHVILGGRKAKRAELIVTSIPRIHSGLIIFVNVILINYYLSEICEFVTRVVPKVISNNFL
jgi:hypothetical protein